MVPQPDTNNMNNDNSNTAQGDQIAAAFIRAVVDAVLVSPDLNRSLISLNKRIEMLMDGDIVELRDQLNKVLGRVEEVEDTVSECDGLRHRVDDLESQVEDLDAVTTDQVEDIVSDRLSDVTPITAKHIVTLGLRGLVDEATAEDAKI